MFLQGETGSEVVELRGFEPLTFVVAKASPLVICGI